MLKKLRLIKYRCYEDHEFDFKSLTITIGKNNAGKSTLIEALRLISLVANRIKTSNFRKPPTWTDFPKSSYGISPSLARIEFSFKNIIYHYDEPPAKIIAEFINGEVIEIQLFDNGNIFGVARDSNGNIISSQSDAKTKLTRTINILPQISPLQEEEKALEEQYVKSNIYSALASRHFRNQLSYLNSYFHKFKKIAEETWDGLRIIELTKATKKFTTIDPVLLVQEGGFVTELGSMGHGLQMWLQTMWFLSRIPDNSTVVLDEPDVYMHADLQRKLIRMLKGKFDQIIIATHSLEIMAEVEPENILIIDRKKTYSKFATDLPSIQKVIYNDIGSIHNLGLARLWSARKFLMVEGDDVSMLKRIQNTILPKSNEPFDNIPNSDIGGWGGWRYAIGSRYVLKNAGDESLRIYCLLDSDYHILPDIEAKYNEAKKYSINLHIWKRKEIENYLINANAIYRIIKRKKKSLALTISEIEQKIDELCDLFRQDIEDDYASEISKYYRNKNLIINFLNENKEMKYEAKNINKLARKIVSKRWDHKIEIVPGKKMIKELNKWLSDEYKVNINSLDLANELKKEEIEKELMEIIEKIERLRPFKNEV